MRRYLSAIIFVIYIFSASVYLDGVEANWVDLPSDPLATILYKYDVKLDALNQRIQSYHSVDKTSWLEIDERIASLEEIAIYAEDISKSIQEKYAKEVALKLATVALRKKKYLEELKDLKMSKLEKLKNDIFDFSHVPKQYIPLVLNNGRKLKYQTQEVWGQYFIEAVDPCHRRLLTSYHDIWVKEFPNDDLADFVLWLEDQNVSLLFPSVYVLKDEDLEKNKILIRNGKFYTNDGELLTTQRCEKGVCSDSEPCFIREPIFVITPQEQIYMCYSGKNYAHTSLSGYMPIIGSGSICIENGEITKLSLNSGHYLPTMAHHIQTFKFFENRGVHIDDAIEIRYYNGFDEFSTTAENFRDLYIK